jgi:hypothetical protein
MSACRFESKRQSKANGEEKPGEAVAKGLERFADA